jgi:hypothetical protein
MMEVVRGGIVGVREGEANFTVIANDVEGEGAATVKQSHAVHG